MGIPIVEFMREYKFSAGYTLLLLPQSKKIKRGLNYFDNFFLFFKDYLHETYSFKTN